MSKEISTCDYHNRLSIRMNETSYDPHWFMTNLMKAFFILAAVFFLVIIFSDGCSLREKRHTGTAELPRPGEVK